MAQFEFIESVSAQNYSPHTAWIREDGKQPRVVRHDGLAFIPDPRLYGKSRPAALNDFVAYKHLPRANPRVSGKKTTKPLSATEDTQVTIKPKRSPPKTIQDVLQQPLNRKTWDHKSCSVPSTTNRSSHHAQSKNPKPQQRTKPSGKMSPQKKPKIDLSNFQFECDTSISLSTDTDVNEKTPSPDKPAAKRVDIKATPEQKSPEIRRSSRQRKSALATKLGEAIPIAQIAENSVPFLVAHVELATADVSSQDQPIVTPQNNQPEFGTRNAPVTQFLRGNNHYINTYEDSNPRKYEKRKFGQHYSGDENNKLPIHLGQTQDNRRIVQQRFRGGNEYTPCHFTGTGNLYDLSTRKREHNRTNRLIYRNTNGERSTTRRYQCH